MSDSSDMELVRDYGRLNSEAAFAELVQRHIALVYSAALRHVGISAHAEEITQAVFIILARKSAGLRPDTILEGWLHETTRLTALSFLRGERRRQFREQEAYMQSSLQESTDASTWNQLAPLLDEAMARLGKKDRDAVLLRFFKEQSVRDVAATLQVNEAAAQRRILRALEKLRKFFMKRGVSSTTVIIAGMISANSVQAAPVALAKAVTAIAVAKGAAASGSTLTLIKGALKIMAWTKMKTAIVAGAVVLLAVGTTTVTVKEIQNRQDAKWDAVFPLSLYNLNKAPHVVKIIPTKYPDRSTMVGNHYRMLGVGYTIGRIITSTYDGKDTRTIFSTILPDKKYDFVSNVNSPSNAAMKQLIKKQFGLVARTETIETNVLFLRVKQPDAPGLKKPASRSGSSMSVGQGSYQVKNGTINYVTYYFEETLQIPILDQTGLNGNYDIDLTWDNSANGQENWKQAIADQLGLELVPGTAPVDFLVVEKAK